MRIAVFYATLHPKTAYWAGQHGAELVDVSAHNESYYEALRARWAAAETLLVVEQDIVPPDLSGIAACDEEWCCHPYYVDPIERILLLGTGLGCTKFSATLMRRLPGIFDDLPRGWRSLDTFLAHALVKAGVAHHLHAEHAEHYHGR